MYQALLTGVLRGMDSTGMFLASQDTDTDVVIYKKAMIGYDFVNTVGYDLALSDLSNRNFVVGHNRASTRGSSTDKNAHPFTFGDITMVHNGTISNSYDLYDGAGAFRVDSEALCYAISKHGAEEVLPKIIGSYAIIWYDKSTGKMYVARNEHRNFHFTFSKDKRAMYLVSENNHLEWLTNRIVGLDTGDHFYPAADKIYEFDANDLTGYTCIADVPHKIQPLYKPFKTKNHEHSLSHRLEQYRDKGANRKVIVDNSKSILKRHGFALNKNIDFTAAHFVPYNSEAQFGIISGVCQHNNLAIIVHSVPTKQAERFLALPFDQVLRGKINYAREATPNRVTINMQYNSVNVVKINKTKQNKVQRLLFPGPNGNKISRDIFNTLTSTGCTFCQSDIEERDANEVAYIPYHDGGGVLCGECVRTLEPEMKGNMAISFPIIQPTKGAVKK